MASAGSGRPGAGGAAGAGAGAAPVPGAAKVALNRTTFVLGHDAVDYETDSKRQFKWPEASGALETRQFAKDVAKHVRETHIVFGEEEATWETDHHAFADPRGEGRAQAVQRDLRRTNFILGTDDVKYETDYTAAFAATGAAAESAAAETLREQQAERVRQKTLMDDIRRTHFTLGEEEVEYSTSAADGLALGAVVDPDERARTRKEIDAFKRSLREQHFALGYDGPTDYGRTNDMPAVDTRAARRELVKRDTQSTNFSLGEEEADWRTTNMVATGQRPEEVRVGTIEIPARPAGWEDRVQAVAQRRFR